MTSITSNLTKVVTSIVCIAVVLFGLLPHGLSQPVHSPAEVTKSQIDRLAGKYTNAVQQLSRIAMMSLKTEREFSQANTIVKDQLDNLDFVKYRMVQIALQNAQFVSAIENEFTKAKGDTTEKLQAFRRSPNVLTNIRGAAQVRQNIDTNLRNDLAALRRASEHLRNAAQSIMGKPGGQPQKRTGQTVAIPSSITGYFEALLAASSIVAGVASRGGNGGGGSPSHPCIATGTCWLEEGREFDRCLKEAGDTCDRCQAACSGLFQWACEASCHAIHMATKVECNIVYLIATSGELH